MISWVFAWGFVTAAVIAILINYGHAKYLDYLERADQATEDESYNPATWLGVPPVTSKCEYEECAYCQYKEREARQAREGHQ